MYMSTSDSGGLEVGAPEPIWKDRTTLSLTVAIIPNSPMRDEIRRVRMRGWSFGAGVDPFHFTLPV